jgi:hypothetical protein
MAHFVDGVKVVWKHRDEACKRHRAPLVELDHLLLMLVLALAVLASSKQQDHDRVSLEIRQAARNSVLIGKFEIGEHRALN